MLLPYTKYLLTAKTRHGIHSPFVYDFMTNVLEDKGRYHPYDELEGMRKRFLADSKVIMFDDFGTGVSGKRKISDIASRSLVPEKYGRLLFRIANYYRPRYILELGTSLGLSTLYLAMAASAEKIITMEGCGDAAKYALRLFMEKKFTHIELLPGNIDQYLPSALAKLPHADLVFFDANHRYAPTLDYFRQCLEKKTDGSIFIFDDIHYSAEMLKAWKEIREHEAVTVSIDLFRMGILFFRPGQAKEHFTIRF